MKNVRKDVIVKLLTGLINSRKYAIEHDASYPNTYRYKTRKCEHYVTHDVINECYHFNSVNYDGTRSHTTLRCDADYDMICYYVHLVTINQINVKGGVSI